MFLPFYSFQNVVKRHKNHDLKQNFRYTDYGSIKSANARPDNHHLCLAWIGKSKPHATPSADNELNPITILLDLSIHRER